MKKYLPLLLILILVPTYGNTWYSTKKVDTIKDRVYIGYVDKNGTEKIKPKFHNYCTRANRFDDIIAVNEVSDDGSNLLFYYLTKSGKRVQEGMPYIRDHTCDCESEGFIRFSDKKTNLNGMLNKEGNVVIPAKYYYLSKVNNNLIIGTIGDSIKHLHDCDKEFSLFEWIHDFFRNYNTVWETYLLDTSGKILVKDFNRTDIDLYSLQKSSHKPILTKYQKTFLGTDEKYYTFELYKKTFKHWIKENIFLNLTKKSLLLHTKRDKEKLYVKRNFKKIKDRLLKIQKRTIDYFLSQDSFYYEQNSSPLEQKYFDNCNDGKANKYPKFSFIIGDLDNREYLTFLKDSNKYYLLEISLRDEI